MTSWRYAAASDTGLVRQDNQDAVYVDDELAIVADGMGGHAAGEVAAQIAVEHVREAFAAHATVDGFFRAVDEANGAVFRDARENPDHFGMGTTVIALGLVHSEGGQRHPIVVHVGDSRAYQLRDGALRQLSDDHSVAEEWVRMGRLTPEEAAVHPRRHQLTRGVGVEEKVSVDVFSLDVRPGDRLLLCSDGLSNELDDDTIAELASAPHSLTDAVAQLVSAARAAGGRDNISVALVEFDEVDPGAITFRRTMSSAPNRVVRPVAVAPTRRRRRFTWRLFAALALLLAVAVGVVAVIHWYAYSTYYLADDNGVIAVYQGQPSGVLWYQPTKVLDTKFKVTQLRTSDQTSLTRTISEPSVADALQYATYIHRQWETQRLSRRTSSTTSTTSTTSGLG